MYPLIKRSYLCLRTIVLLTVLSIVVLPAHAAVSAQSSTASEQDGKSASSVQKITATDKKIEKNPGDTAKNAEKEGEETTEEEGMSTLTKVGIGVGVAVAVGVVVGLAASGSSDSGPSYPSSEDLLGSWHAEGLCLVDGRTYSGTYNYYAVGSHTYDIVREGDRLTGNGNWSLTEGTYSLRMENDTGSVYKGEFAAGNYDSITMTTTDGRWQVILTR